MNFANIESTWEIIKDRPLGEYLNYLNDKCSEDKKKGDGPALERDAQLYAAAAIAAYHFAQHITGEKDA